MRHQPSTSNARQAAICAAPSPTLPSPRARQSAADEKESQIFSVDQDKRHAPTKLVGPIGSPNLYGLRRVDEAHRYIARDFPTLALVKALGVVACFWRIDIR